MELSNHKFKNALSLQLVKELESFLKEIRSCESTNAVLIKSSVPGVFCAGANLKERLKMSNFETEQFVKYMGETVEILYNLPQITIAMIEGAALGGGLEIALSCDLRYSTNSAKLGLPELNLAIIPGIGGTQLLPRIIGPSKAKEMIYFSQILKGDEAKNIGLVNDSFENSETLDSEVILRLNELQKKGPIALKAAKEAISNGLEVDLKRGLEIERLAYFKTLISEDRIEGLKAFTEKRKPEYKGK